MVKLLGSVEQKELTEGWDDRYLPTGDLVYRQQNSNNLFAIPFDLDSFKAAGNPVPIVKGELWQVSTGGGDSPLWSPDGKELFYRSGDAVTAAPVVTEPTFSPGISKILTLIF
jgi:hypothetical protein